MNVNTQNSSKMKAVFYDAANARYMGIANGISQIKYRSLVEILADEIGSSPLDDDNYPMAVFPPEWENFESIKKVMLSGGFAKVVEAWGSVGASEDDRLIISRIDTLDPGLYDEIVVISSDQDYCPILKKKFEEGFRVYMLCTNSPGIKSGRPMLRPETEETFAGVINFIKFEDIKDRIIHRALIQNTPAPEPENSDNGAGNHRKVSSAIVSAKVEIQLRSSLAPKFFRELSDYIMDLQRRYPELEASLNIKSD